MGVVAVGLEQFRLVHHVFSLMVAVMGLVGVVCLLHRSEMHLRARGAVTLVGLAGVAGSYSYIRLYESWNQAYSMVTGGVGTTGAVVGTTGAVLGTTGAVVGTAGHLFDDTYRYGEWLMTAPLVLVALLLLLEAKPRPVWSHLVVPVLAAAGMVAAACAGSFLATAETRVLWVLLSLAPFSAVLYHLYVAVAPAVHEQPAAVRGLVVGARFALLVAWSAFELVCALPLFGMGDTAALIVGQLGFAGADLLAVVGAGMLVFAIAVRKSDAARKHAGEGQALDPVGPLARPVAGSVPRMNADISRYG